MDHRENRFRRLAILGVLLGLALLAYVGVLYDVQVNQHEEYLTQSIRSIAREEKVEASRGIITDRSGRPLVSNRSTYSLTFDASLLKDGEDQNDAVLRLLKLCREQGVDWVDNLPRHIGSMIKQFGWIYGVRLAIGGAGFTAIGCLARFMFRTMILGSTGSSMGGNYGFQPFGTEFGYPMEAAGSFFDSAFDSFNSTAWSMASTFTGFIIGLGVVIMLCGIILAVALKKWGSKPSQ